jgi:hypothetical protein
MRAQHLWTRAMQWTFVLALGCTPRLQGVKVLTVAASPEVTASVRAQGSRPSGDTRASTGTLKITLVDQNNNHPADIPVSVDGPVRKTVLSDSSGQVIFDGPTGSYRFDVGAGCSDDVIVSFGQSGAGYVGPGQTAAGTLTVNWHHRIGPGESVYPSEMPHWRVGDVIDVAYDVVDRCNDQKAPLTSLTTYAFDPSANVELVETSSMLVDENSQAHLRVRCTSAGPMSLVLFDRANPPDRTDLVSLIFFYSTNKSEVRGECRNPGPTP